MSEPKMDTNVTAQGVTPQGGAVTNGTPGKAQGYGVAAAPFEAPGDSSLQDYLSLWPADQNAGQYPGWGSTKNSPNS